MIKNVTPLLNTKYNSLSPYLENILLGKNHVTPVRYLALIAMYFLYTSVSNALKIYFCIVMAVDINS